MDEPLTVSKKRPMDIFLYGLVYLCAGLSVALLVVLLAYVLIKGIGQVNWQFLTTVTSVLKGTVGIAGNLLNTLIITVGGTVGHVILASLAAYPLSKHRFKGRDTLFNLVVLSMMFSWTVTQIPNYMIISWLGINNTYLALILPACSYGMGLYLMKQFIDQLPDSLMESARLDGANEFRVYMTIVMPNVKPAWLTLAIFQFQQMWGNTGAMFLRDEELKPLQFALQQIAAGGTARAGASAAVTFIIAAIPITFFLICQSNVLETMTTSGMKE